MLFRTVFRKEFASTAGATFVALLSIIITIVLVRTLGQAAGGRVDNAEVLPLILLGGLQYLAPALVITVFIAVMASVSRAFRDNEMTAWFASGLPLTALIRPVLLFAIPLTLLALVCSVWLTPWSKAQLIAAKERFAQRSEVSKVSAGRFRESSNGQRVFFVERHDESAQKVNNVFVLEEKDDQRVVVVARSGSVQNDQFNQKYLILEQGRRFGLEEGGQKFSSINFESHGIAVQTNLASAPNLQLKHQDIKTVLAQRTPEAMGEVLWRVSLPLSALVLALLAIPLAFVNPRGGQSVNQLFALLIYLTYSNAVSITQSLVVNGTIPFPVGLVLPHVLVLILFAWLMLRRGRPSGLSFITKFRYLKKLKAQSNSFSSSPSS